MKKPIDPDHQLVLFEQVLSTVSRRRCISDDEGEEFVSWARERFVTSRETIFERFRGEGKATTYLTVVVVNLLRDFRRERWGKWRPSAAANRLGPVAIRLEQLTSRDGFSLEEAVESLRRNEGVRESAEQLRSIAARLPVRIGRRFEGDEALQHVAAGDRADRRVEALEARRTAAQVERALEASLGRLESEDRLILQLHIAKGFTIADVSRALHLDQKPLYRRVPQLLLRLRCDLESCGIRGDDILRILGAEEGEVRLPEMRDDESPSPGPSQGLGR